ncbi:hypothetical protein M670_02099 [Schinkia azotoformans MEV2011]|uniref:Uncharacterized protein n=1 Tax=Schinkia azotoformans MEV2011 TaxID=1348973 RepID=A0A072NNH3_SCHAZ|nr:hypothetical protein M670_02099 [Schinkia azotoformans MEV2011]
MATDRGLWARGSELWPESEPQFRPRVPTPYKEEKPWVSGFFLLFCKKLLITLAYYM